MCIRDSLGGGFEPRLPAGFGVLGESEKESQNDQSSHGRASGYSTVLIRSKARVRPKLFVLELRLGDLVRGGQGNEDARQECGRDRNDGRVAEREDRLL